MVRVKTNSIHLWFEGVSMGFDWCTTIIIVPLPLGELLEGRWWLCFLLHACHWLVLDDYPPRLLIAFNLFTFQFADSWTATIAQSTPRTTEGILSVWDTTDTRDDGLRMRSTMRGVVGSLVSFLGNSSPDTTCDTAPLQVAFVLLVWKEAVGLSLSSYIPCGKASSIWSITIIVWARSQYSV